MTGPRRSRSLRPTIHRPPWQERLPRHLRLAAEWQFGTPALLALVQILKGEFAGAFFFLMMTTFCFFFLAGWYEERRINSPYAWWGFVDLLAAGGAVATVGSIFGDVS